jgi:hypothetical protein
MQTTRHQTTQADLLLVALLVIAAIVWSIGPGRMPADASLRAAIASCINDPVE